MHIQHSNPHTSTLGHNGVHYEALRDGIFKVPDEVGDELIQHSQWSRYAGEAPYEVSGGPAEAPPAPQAAAPASVPPPLETTDWFARGEEAAKAGAPRLPLPDELKDRPRHRDSRTYLAGHDSVTQAEAEPPEA